MSGVFISLAKRIWRHPYGVQMGTGTSLLRPWHIKGRQYIAIGADTRILDHFRVQAIDEYAGQRYSPSVIIGNNIYIGREAYFTAIDRIEIGDGCVLSDYVYITDEMHGIAPDGGPIMEQPLLSKGPVKIGRRCFLGFRAAILPGVTLGDHCVVGSAAVVTRSFPAFSMIAGSPARLVKRYNQGTRSWDPASE